MKAMDIHQYNDTLHYEDLPMPELHPRDVLVKVYATSVNPIDWKIIAGQRKQPGTTFPLIPGWDVSGTIEKMGYEVSDFMIDDEVYGRSDPSRNGAYAEYIAVRADELGRKPKTLDHVAAATVPLAGQTAWQALFDHGHLQKGQRVLIHAAAGGVGTFAVQFAKWKGAYVIGTASGSNIDFLKKLGADEVIDHIKEQFDEKLRDIDLVLDTLGGEVQTRSMKVLKPGGTLVTTVGIADPAAFAAKGLKGIHFAAVSTKEQLQQIAALIDEGKVKPVVSKTFPLTDAALALELVKNGHTRGKIALQVI